MLAYANRLHKNYQFRYVYRHGKFVTSKDFSLVFCTSKQKRPTFGFSVSTKNGKAVKRNRLKRLMRESVSLLLPKCKGNFNAIVCAKKDYVFDVSTTQGDILQQIEYMLKKVKLIDDIDR